MGCFCSKAGNVGGYGINDGPTKNVIDAMFKQDMASLDSLNLKPVTPLLKDVNFATVEDDIDSDTIDDVEIEKLLAEHDKLEEEEDSQNTSNINETGDSDSNEMPEGSSTRFEQVKDSESDN